MTNIDFGTDRETPARSSANGETAGGDASAAHRARLAFSGRVTTRCAAASPPRALASGVVGLIATLLLIGSGERGP